MLVRTCLRQGICSPQCIFGNLSHFVGGCGSALMAVFAWLSMAALMQAGIFGPQIQLPVI